MREHSASIGNGQEDRHVVIVTMIIHAQSDLFNEEDKLYSRDMAAPLGTKIGIRRFSARAHRE